MTTLTRYISSLGQPISLGRELGRGGEGSVYEVSPNVVAKIYHHSLEDRRQEKLLAMIQGSNDQLQKISAWPIDVIRKQNSTDVCGFLMPNIQGYAPIHRLYNPGERKRHFPNADWSFLVATARNVAAAFAIIHSRGHVIGDVNQNNLLVAKNTTIKLLDCDSFQISTNQYIYVCEVGVAHFTPPELQNLKYFNSQPRTVNHDNFGLALLCFHLLLMGRHPFAGGADSIEEAIQKLLFPYSSTAQSNNLKPPPNSVGLSVLSQKLSNYFEESFSSVGISKHRPEAKDWVIALDELGKHITQCQREVGHKYYSGLNNCPWCALEQNPGIVYFISPRTGQVFDITSILQDIFSLTLPQLAPLQDPNHIHLTPNALPPEVIILDTRVQKIVSDINSIEQILNEVEKEVKEAISITQRFEIDLDKLNSKSISMKMRNQAENVLLLVLIFVLIALSLGVIAMSLTVLSISAVSGIMLSLIIQFPRNKRRREVSELHKYIDDAKQKLHIATLHQERVKEKRELFKGEMSGHISKKDECLKDKEHKIQQERERLKDIIDEAERTWTQLQDRWTQLNKANEFSRHLQLLHKLKDEHKNANQKYNLEKSQLIENARDRQFHHFLENYSIEDYKISGIGEARKALLRSYGIETAADIKRYSIQGIIPGFGPDLTEKLLSWRKGFEAKFRFDPNKSVDPLDIAQLDQKFRRLKQPIEDELISGVDKLKKMKPKIIQQRHELHEQAWAVARTLVQAKADMSLLKLV
jgi:DNA-binding helix-hairpin-helix protein with protein kinase domain